MKEKLLSYLGQIHPLNEKEEQLVGHSFVRQSYTAKNFLLPQGEVCQHLFFIVEGIVRVGLVNQAGEDITTYFQTEDNFVTDYESFLHDSPAHFFIQSLEDTTVLRIDRYGIHRLYEQTNFGDKLGRVIAEELFVATNRRLLSFYLQSPEERYQTLLTSSPRLINRVSQSHIASYIGVKPQSLSRIKRRFQQDGT